MRRCGELRTVNAVVNCRMSNVCMIHIYDPQHVDIFPDTKTGNSRRQTVVIIFQLQHPFVIHTCQSSAHASLRRANPPAFLTARLNSPAVRWSGFSFRSFAIACTSSPYLPTRRRSVACSLVEANLCGRALRSCDISSSAVRRPRLSTGRRQ